MSHPKRTRAVVFAHIPRGKPDDSVFRFEETDLPQPKDGELLLKVEYLSVDPYLRGKMSGVKTYTDPFREGEVLCSPGVCRVLVSRSPKFKEGDLVGTSSARWAEHMVASEAHVRPVFSGVDPEGALSAVGMTALTAYFGLLRVGKLKEKDTVLITSAAGGVGYVAGCIAKLHGCRVIGIVGSEEKGRFIRGLGYDEFINYKSGRLEEDLKRVCPDGISLFFDNVGGETGDVVRRHMKTGGRVVQCGGISNYNADKEPQGPRQEMLLVTKRLKWKGFIVYDFRDQFDAALKQLAEWYRAGKIPAKVHVFKGLEQCPQAFLGLFEGKNTGKTLVKL